MGDNHHGHSLVRQLPHDLQHLSDHLWVQGAGGLVKEDYVRVHGQGADNGNPLLLSAGDAARIDVRLVRQSDAFQQPAGVLLRLGLGLPLQGDGGKGDVLHHRQVGKQVEVLEHHSHFAPHRVDVHPLGSDILSLKPDFSAGGGLQQVQAPQEGGFPRTGGPDDHYLFPLLYGLGNAV